MSETHNLRIKDVQVSDETLAVELSDGRTVSLPLDYYPRLLDGTSIERKRWQLVGQGAGVYWFDLDEEISIGNILAGKPSGESQRSFQKWQAGHRKWG
jgi:hypothetical protein